jgi:hypothetical protein
VSALGIGALASLYRTKAARADAVVSKLRPCEHAFVGSQGHPRAEFQRAVERGNLLQAKALAKVVANSAGKLSLGDALSLLFLMAAKRDESFERAALRWLARFVQEVPAATLEEAQLVLGALAMLDRLEKDGTAQEALQALCRRHGLKPPRVALG